MDPLALSLFPQLLSISPLFPLPASYSFVIFLIQIALKVSLSFALKCLLQYYLFCLTFISIRLKFLLLNFILLLNYECKNLEFLLFLLTSHF